MTGGKYAEVCQKGKHKQLYEVVVGGGVDPWNLFPCSQYRRLYKQTNSVALVHTRTIPTERPPPVGEVSANFCG